MFSFSTISEYHKNLNDQKFNCVDAVNYYLQNIENNTQLNAFVEVYKEEAIKTAKLLDAKRNSDIPLKKLHGVIIAIKDVICYKYHSATAASKILTNFHQPICAHLPKGPLRSSKQPSKK